MVHFFYEWKCVANHGKQYGEVLKAIMWFDGEFDLKGAILVFRNHLGLYRNLVCIALDCFRIRRMWGSQKA